MASESVLVKPNTTFTLALFKQLSDKSKTKNIFYSPFSISSALAMVMLGARGNTAAQMAQVLGFTDAEQPQQPRMQQCLQQIEDPPQSGQYDDVHTGFAKVMKELNKEDAPYSLSTANRLYGDQSFQFVQSYLADTLKYYQAELEPVDFQGDPEIARVNINAWVAEKTKDKIKELLAKDVVNRFTKLVLVNAIYFKGKWEKQFKDEYTSDAVFRLSKNDKTTVKMMSQTSEFPFESISEPKCKILEMPYKGKDLSMLIFLPDEIEDETTGLEELEKKLDYENFVKWTDKMSSEEVEVSLPRFKMAEQYGLNDVLLNMGMTDAFNDVKSDFSGMSLNNKLVLSNVVHKSFVEVNEEGTEAAATTAATFVLTSVNFKNTFKADHPFLFFIRHNATKSVLFAGKFSSPESTE